jgi:L-fuconolactonase
MNSTPFSENIDSHHHFWDLSRFDYEWMPPPPNILRRNYLPENLRPLLRATGFDRTIVVQAHKSVSEANFLLDLADAGDFVAGVVAWVGLTKPDVGDVLDELMERPKLVGIRHQVEDDPDDEWLTRDDSVRGLHEVAARGLAYDVLVKPRHLKYVPALAKKIPDLRMVVDHMAKPFIADGVMEPWATDIAAVAEIPGVYCKVSGMVTEADHASWTVEDLKPYVAHVMDCFGIDRLMWGSDWPVCLLAAGYEQVFNAAQAAIGPLSESDRARLLGRNAKAFYRL